MDTSCIKALSSCCCGLNYWCSCTLCAPTPQEPDYSNLESWASVFGEKESPGSNFVPTYIYTENKKEASGLKADQDSAEADVFYVHPTFYTGIGCCLALNESVPNHPCMTDRLLCKLCNCDYDAEDIVKIHASAFNGSCRVYAPYYRQASTVAYMGPCIQQSALSAFSNAYDDVERAFIHFYENWNKDRPYFLCGHSQGSEHLALLIERIGKKNPEMLDNLVCAYLIGAAIGEDTITTEKCKISESSNQTQCWTTYCTVGIDCKEPINITGLHGTGPQDLTKKGLSVNPLTWSYLKTGPIGKTQSEELHLGALHKDCLYPNFIKATVDHTYANNNFGLLRIQETQENKKFPIHLASDFDGIVNDFHINDIELFWMNIRQNVDERLNAWKEQNL